MDRLGSTALWQNRYRKSGRSTTATKFPIAARSISDSIGLGHEARMSSRLMLPWWYRVYYLHIAGTTFLAAMFVPELYSESVAQSWCSVISALRSHHHLSAYVQECISTLETLSARILQPQGLDSLNDENFGSAFDDLFCDTGFDFDAFVSSANVAES